jgi:hypothetical protein
MHINDIDAWTGIVDSFRVHASLKILVLPAFMHAKTSS